MVKVRGGTRMPSAISAEIGRWKAMFEKVLRRLRPSPRSGVAERPSSFSFGLAARASAMIAW
jgi:hypothetical protein